MKYTEEEMQLKKKLYDIFRASNTETWEYFCMLLKNHITGAITILNPTEKIIFDLSGLIKTRLTFDCPYCDAPLGYEMPATIDNECYECGRKININEMDDSYSLYHLDDEFFKKFIHCFTDVFKDRKPLFG